MATLTAIHAVPAARFRLLLVDKPKPQLGKNVVNAGFFGIYHEDGEEFTLPAGHLTCDYAAESKWTRHYGEERGRFEGDKFSFDCSTWSYQNQFQGKALSTLVVKDGTACIVESAELPEGEYAISGVPVIRGGKACAWSQATAQGWTASSSRATWHTMVGLKDDANTVYVFGFKSATINLIKSGEAAEALLALGFRDVIKLDGGLSFYMDANGTTTSTGGSRRINTVIPIDGGDNVTADKILNIAQCELGVKEEPAGSNTVKYNTAYYGREVSGSTYAWCAAFVWWVFRQAGASSLYYGGGKTAYCPTLLSYHKGLGEGVHGNYRPGDIIFFNFSGGTSASHVGICESWDGTFITTIDGNTGTDSESNGGAVMRRRRSAKYIVGAYRPYHSEEKVYPVDLPLLQNGSAGESVKAMQILLTGLGHNAGGADGTFGANTQRALKEYQGARGLEPDGMCGPATWGKLLGR